MCKAFQENKDIYATIASIAFNVPYEACLEFHPVTHEYQAEGKARRSEAKSVVLGKQIDEANIVNYAPLVEVSTRGLLKQTL